LFIKFNSLDNLHSTVLSHEHMNAMVSISEKIDGSNMSLCVRDADWSFASRNQKVDPTWNNLGELVPQEFINKVMSLHKNVNIYGEVFSSKILKRIPYGDARVLFYAMTIDGVLQSKQQFAIYMTAIGYPELVHSEIGRMTLKEAIEFDVEDFDTLLIDEKHPAEGIVITGYNDVMIDRFGNPMTIKLKSKKFSEKDNSKKKPRVITPIEDNPMFPFVNENRMLSFISKEGEIEDKKQLGVYIKGIIEDAWEDFIKENEGQEDNRRSICGPLSKVVAAMLQERMKENWENSLENK